MPRKPKMTEDERRAYSAKMRDELETVMDRAYGAMVASEEFWATVLRTAATLSDRSPVNSIAITAQCPHATRVLSVGDWRKVGRFPVKGSTSIRIWTPIKRRSESAQDATTAIADGGQREAVGDAADGGERRVSGYKAGPVFDISQTDGDAYEPSAAVRFPVEGIRAALDRQAQEPGGGLASSGEDVCVVRLHLYEAASRSISEAEAPLFGQREAEIASAAHVAALILGIAPGPAVIPPLKGIITRGKKPPVHESAVRVIETGRAVASAAAKLCRELTPAGCPEPNNMV
ncbi:hypothetical protein AB0I22_19540 [Streptomyces sp. NPDC050610]|uniref:hypothetical protein n=1 Tax=Streptomyces sp. NPDC050610 TaxID=3157097 RepID=UPI003449B38C